MIGELVEKRRFCPLPNPIVLGGGMRKLSLSFDVLGLASCSSFALFLVAVGSDRGPSLTSRCRFIVGVLGDAAAVAPPKRKLTRLS